MQIPDHDATGSNSDLGASSASSTKVAFGKDEAILFRSMRKQGKSVDLLLAEVNAHHGTKYSRRTLTEKVSRLLHDLKPAEIADMITLQRYADGAPTPDTASNSPDTPAGEVPSMVPGIVPLPQPIPQSAPIPPSVSSNTGNSNPQTVASNLPAVISTTVPLTQSVPPPVASTGTPQTVIRLWDREKSQATTIVPPPPKLPPGPVVANPPISAKLVVGNPTVAVATPEVRGLWIKVREFLIGLLAVLGLVLGLMVVSMVAGTPILGRSIALLDQSSVVVPRAPFGLNQKEYNVGIALFSEFAKSPEPGPQTQLAMRQAGLPASLDFTKVALLNRLVGTTAQMPPEEQAIAWDRIIVEAVRVTKNFHPENYLYVLALNEDVFKDWFGNDAERLRYTYNSLSALGANISSYKQDIAAITQMEQRMLVLRKDLEERKLRLERERSPAVKPRP